MSKNWLHQSNGKFGFQILYKGFNAETSKLQIGKESIYPIELEIRFEHSGNSTGMADAPTIPGSFTFNPSSQKKLASDDIHVPENTLLIRYSRDLFNLCCLRKSFEVTPTLLAQFEKDLNRIYS